MLWDPSYRRPNSILDMLNGIGTPRILCDSCIGVVYLTRACHKTHVLQDSSKLNCLEYLGFFFRRQINGLGIATSLKIKNSLAVPPMFIITNQLPFRIGRECCFSSTR